MIVEIYNYFSCDERSNHAAHNHCLMDLLRHIFFIITNYSVVIALVVFSLCAVIVATVVDFNVPVAALRKSFATMLRKLHSDSSHATLSVVHEKLEFFYAKLATLL